MNANTHSLSEIIKTTAATSVWCDLHWKSAEPANSLRSPLLFPELLTRNIYGCVCDVISKRRKDLEDNKIEVSSTALKGKILVYEPASNLFDGLGQSESAGYLDFYDCPPWDTWIGLITQKNTEFLLCWVPAKAVSLVNDGIDVICSDCISWLDDSSESWAMELKHA